MVISEKQYENIEFIVGEVQSDTLSDMRRLVIL